MTFVAAFEEQGHGLSRPIVLGRASSLTKRRGGRALWASPPARPRLSASGAMAGPCIWVLMQEAGMANFLW